MKARIYPRETRERARRMVIGGMSKTDAARECGVFRATMTEWTPDIRLKKRYPRKIRLMARKLPITAKLFGTVLCTIDPGGG